MIRGTETLLIIDDEEIVRRAAVSILERLGYQTLAAATGGQGLSLYRQHQDRVDLILLDLNLPDRTGAEVYAELRNISPVVPIALFIRSSLGHVPRLARTAQKLVVDPDDDPEGG